MVYTFPLQLLRKLPFQFSLHIHQRLIQPVKAIAWVSISCFKHGKEQNKID